jgi:mono/diheme cytochrome c family protein
MPTENLFIGRVGLVSGLLAAVLILSANAGAQTPAFAPQDERLEDLPPGAGRDETFGLCSACHGFRLVSNQGQTRPQWDDTLIWMTERHNMPNVQGAERDLILDYLARHYAPKAPSGAGGWKNPFAPQ